MTKELLDSIFGGGEQGAHPLAGMMKGFMLTRHPDARLNLPVKVLRAVETFHSHDFELKGRFLFLEVQSLVDNKVYTTIQHISTSGRKLEEGKYYRIGATPISATMEALNPATGEVTRQFVTGWELGLGSGEALTKKEATDMIAAHKEWLAEHYEMHEDLHESLREQEQEMQEECDKFNAEQRLAKG